MRVFHFTSPPRRRDGVNHRAYRWDAADESSLRSAQLNLSSSPEAEGIEQDWRRT